MAKNKSTKERGAEWEREFSKYMTDELEYNDCIMNTTVKGALSTNEYEVDIIGKKLSDKGESYNNVGVFLIVLAIIVIGLELFFDVVIFVDNAMYILGGLFIVGFVFLQLAKDHEWEYSWVECKNHQKPIDKKAFSLLKSNVEDYHNSKDKKFDFKNKILVSKSGFTKNAIRFAEEYNIECYDKCSGSIQKTDIKTI